MSLSYKKKDIRLSPQVKLKYDILQVEQLADQLGVNFVGKKYTLDDFYRGFNVEVEHIDSVGGQEQIIGKIVLDHLNEKYDYYDGLEVIEKTKPGYWRSLIVCVPVYIVVIVLLLLLFYHLWIIYNPQFGTFNF